MSGVNDPVQAATATLTLMGARVVEDRGKVLLIDLAEAPISDEDLSILGNFPFLRSLTLADTDITDAGLQHLADLTSLETLDLSTTQVTTAGLACLTKLQKIDMLILGGCKVSNSGLYRLERISVAQNADSLGYRHQ
jgi:internalin A